jgi:hypothetical protein
MSGVGRNEISNSCVSEIIAAVAFSFAALSPHSAESLRLAGRYYFFFEAMPRTSRRHSLIQIFRHDR